MSETPCPTCCWKCAKHKPALNAVLYNTACRAAHAIADRPIECPGRNSPCAAKPGEAGCIGKACGRCEGFERKD
ncbi:MAG: hypothetical protein FD189_1074 [Elusimicrobia bacterium]|nr:MAG: hypothetical protein FD189_1074 [Elusimicrobiota bacterium]